MSENRSAGAYTLSELAQALGVDEVEAAEILDEHGYEVPVGDARLALDAEEYLDLIEAAPLDPDEAHG